jgi:two-component system sensor histidine kinase RegB
MVFVLSTLLERVTRRDPLTIDFKWLIWLRWGAIACQALVILAVHYGLGARLPLAALMLVLALEVALNVVSMAWLRRGGTAEASHVAGAVGADILLFTVLLYFTGGSSNPFSALYLVYIALAAVVLPPRSSFALVAFALFCSSLLFASHVSLPHESPHHHEELGWHLRGSWIAFGAAASLIVYFLNRVLRELSERERELEAARWSNARKERLASLATLAAGAAHELASPLATIAVAATELEKQLAGLAELGEARSDAALIRSQVERCRGVLDQLATDAGQGAGALPRKLVTRELLQRAAEGLDAPRLEIEVARGAESLRGPEKPLVQALRSLIKNGLEASAPEKVAITVTHQGDGVRFRIEDRGPGMAPEVAERAGEPFFTTKGKNGMGLGLFLARSVAEQLGGALELESRTGAGTSATLFLPNEVEA